MSAPFAASGATLHATALLVGESGLLLRGESGSGKSSLAQEIIDLAALAGRFARLVSDDRVAVSARGGRLVVRAVPSIAGLLELRGIGIVRVPHEEAAVVRLVVDCGAQPSRLPDAGDNHVAVCGVVLPRIAVNGTLGARMVLWRLRCLDDTVMTSL